MMDESFKIPFAFFDNVTAVSTVVSVDSVVVRVRCGPNDTGLVPVIVVISDVNKVVIGVDVTVVVRVVMNDVEGGARDIVVIGRSVVVRMDVVLADVVAVVGGDVFLVVVGLAVVGDTYSVVIGVVLVVREAVLRVIVGVVDG